MHFCIQEAIVLLTLIDNVPFAVMWANNLKEKLLCSSSCQKTNVSLTA